MNHALTAVSPIDGRYRSKVEILSDYFSEYALIRYRVRVEIEYFIALCNIPLPQLKGFPRGKFPSLRKIMLSGDFIPLDLPDMCLSRMENAEVYSLGGATEGSIWSIIYKYEGLRPEDKTILYGKPLANQEFRILDSCGRDVPMYVEGELYIVGDGVALGYLAAYRFNIVFSERCGESVQLVNDRPWLAYKGERRLVELRIDTPVGAVVVIRPEPGFA